MPKLRPGGNVPSTTAYVREGTPPLALSVFVYTIGKYTSGANTWKPISERIKDGELYGKDAMIRYYEKEVAKRELDIMSLKQRIAALKSDDNIGIGFPNASEMNDINKSFLQYYEMNEGSGSAAHKKYADQYVGQMLWNFLTQEIN